MKIGVISDTALSYPTERLRLLSRGLFADIDLLLHAGDLTQLSVMDVFSGTDIIAVAGERDHMLVQEKLPVKTIVDICGYRIGLIHGNGSAKTIEGRLLKEFSDIHCIVFGHTAKPVNRIYSGVLMFNPGSFTRRFPFFGHCTVGILNISGGLSGTIVSARDW